MSTHRELVARLLRFLRAHAGAMPRTMLRYATEKLSAKKRAEFMM